MFHDQRLLADFLHEPGREPDHLGGGVRAGTDLDQGDDLSRFEPVGRNQVFRLFQFGQGKDIQ